MILFCFLDLKQSQSLKYHRYDFLNHYIFLYNAAYIYLITCLASISPIYLFCLLMPDTSNRAHNISLYIEHCIFYNFLTKNLQINLDPPLHY